MDVLTLGPEGFFDEFDKSLEALLTPSEKSKR